MGIRRYSLAAAAVLGCGAAGMWAPAHADVSSTLFVDNNAVAHCSDTTSDSSIKPYCTIGAAVGAAQPGQTVQIAGDFYPDTVHVSAVGTAAAPITVRPAPGARVVVGQPIPGSGTPAPGGIVVDHAQYVVIRGLEVNSSTTDAIAVSASSHVTISQDKAYGQVHVTAGSDSTLVTGLMADGIRSVGSTAVLVDGGSTGTVVAGNSTYQTDRAIRVHDAIGTDVTGNTVVASCVAGIEVDGTSTGTVIEDNVLADNDDISGSGGDSTQCGVPADPNTGAIAVADTAVTGTVVDYNVVWAGWAKTSATTPALYRWAGTPYTDEASFRMLGQAAHDINADPLVDTSGSSQQFLGLAEGSPAIDSANATAPGEQPTDATGLPRVDDPTVPNTGFGSSTFYDRGAFEFQDPFAVTAAATTSGLTTATVTATTTGWKNAASYTFDFGNGDVVTQSSPTITHDVQLPTQPGPRTVPVTVSATEQGTGRVATRTVNLSFGYTYALASGKATLAWSEAAHSYLLTVDASGTKPGSMPLVGYSFIVEDQFGTYRHESGRQSSPVFMAPVASGTNALALVSGWDSLGGEGSTYSNAIWVPGPPAGSVVVDRIAGADRYTTAVDVSARQWADAGGDATGRTQAKAVVLATGDGFADAVAGVPLAAHVGGPLLLTGSGGLNPLIQNEIERVLPAHTGKTVYLLGGLQALNQAVADRLTSLGYDVQRFGGRDRFETARIIAVQGLGSPTAVIVATGRDYADALAAGPLAATLNAAILLSDGPALDPDTAAYVERSMAASTDMDRKVWAVGGDGVAAVDALHSTLPWRPIAGPDRYTTAAELAMAFPGDPSKVTAFGVATGTGFADALTGGALMATLGRPLLLTPPGELPSAFSMVLPDWNSLQGVTLFGGTNAVSQHVEDEIAGLTRGTER